MATIKNYQEAKEVLKRSLERDIPARLRAIHAVLWFLVPHVGDEAIGKQYGVIHNEADEVIVHRNSSKRSVAIYTHFSKDSDKMDILVEVKRDGGTVREDIKPIFVNETVFALIGLLGMEVKASNYFNEEYNRTMQAMVEAENEELSSVRTFIETQVEELVDN